MINRRVNIRRDLSPVFLPFFDALCLRLLDPVYIIPLDAELTWQPYGGIRSFMAQDRAYQQGRETVDGIWVVRQPGKVITNAKGGQSPHNYGCASDWCLWSADGEPHWPDPKDPIWKIFTDAVTATGLRPGAEFGDVDHCELRINVSWSTIGTIFHEKGPEAAKAAIAVAASPPKEKLL